MTRNSKTQNMPLKEKIRDVLKSGYFSDPDDLVDVSEGDGDFLHLVIVSRKFAGRRVKEKSDLIWSELVKKLSAKEWGRVSLTIGVSPDEIKVM